MLLGKKKKKKIKTTTVALIIIAVFLIVFTSIILVLFKQTGNSPDTLIVSVFGACIGEMGFCSLIRNAKTKYGVVDNDDEIEEGE